MADDVKILLGELKGGVSMILRRLDASDQETDRKTQDLARQIEGLRADHAADKKEAIEKREENHAQGLAEFKGLREAHTILGGRLMIAEKWIEEKGEPLVGRVSQLESARIKETNDRATDDAARAGEKRGLLQSWKGVVAIAAILGALLTFIGADRLGAILRGVATFIAGPPPSP